jgi:hypothetical protein
MTRKFLMLSSLALLAAAVASPAWSAYIIPYYPAPIWSGGLGVDIQPTGPLQSLSATPSIPGTASLSETLFGGAAQATVTGAATPGPALTVGVSDQLSSLDIDYSHAAANATLSYSFELVGPAGLVPTDISAVVDTTSVAGGSTRAGAAAYLEISQSGGGSYVFYGFACTGGLAEGCPSFNVSSFTLNSVFPLVANHYYNVYMSIGADTYSDQIFPFAAGSGAASAFVDPYVRIDPTFANADQYSLWVTPGVGDAAAVPEPATWAMLMLGLGAVGVALRQRKVAREG